MVAHFSVCVGAVSPGHHHRHRGAGVVHPLPKIRHQGSSLFSSTVIYMVHMLDDNSEMHVWKKSVLFNLFKAFG